MKLFHDFSFPEYDPEDKVLFRGAAALAIAFALLSVFLLHSVSSAAGILMALSLIMSIFSLLMFTIPWTYKYRGLVLWGFCLPLVIILAVMIGAAIAFGSYVSLAIMMSIMGLLALIASVASISQLVSQSRFYG